MLVAEAGIDRLFTSREAISTFGGISIVYSNPRLEVDLSGPHRETSRVGKIGIQPQIGVYLNRQRPMSARISVGHVFYGSETKGLNHSAATVNAALLLNFGQ